MIKFIVVVILIFLALALGHTLIGYQGTVVIATPTTVFEMSLISAVIIALTAVFVFYLVKWLVFKLVRLASGSRNWLGSYSRRQQNKAFFASLNAYLMGDTVSALQQIKKTYGGDFHGSNYLLAANLTDDKQTKSTLLSHASSETEAELAAAVNHAIALLPDQPDLALEQLTSLNRRWHKHALVVRTKLQALSLLNRWQDIRDLITEHKKLLGDDYINWARQATHGEFAAIVSKHGANALREKWQSISRSARKDIANQICYVQLLLDQGFSKEAESTLIEFAKSNEHPAFLGLFKQLNHAEPTAAKGYLERRIKQSPDTPEYYSVLAHLAFNSGDNELAHKAISKALELKYTKQDALLLASVLEQQHAFEKANSLYKKLV